MKSKSTFLTTVSIIALAVMGLFSLQSCEHEGGCGKTKISKTGSDDSHNNGANCQSCHKDGGEGEGCFNLCGSVYNGQSTTPLANVTVKLYTEPQGAGELRFTLKGDTKGNFYTTDDVAFSGLYASVIGPGGTPHYMSASLSSGSCNTCHGVSTDQLNAE